MGLPGFTRKAMEHNYPLTTTLAAGFGISLVLGFLAERIKIPALVGDLVKTALTVAASPCQDACLMVLHLFCY